MVIRETWSDDGLQGGEPSPDLHTDVPEEEDLGQDQVADDISTVDSTLLVCTSKIRRQGQSSAENMGMDSFRLQ